MVFLKVKPSVQIQILKEREWGRGEYSFQLILNVSIGLIMMGC